MQQEETMPTGPVLAILTEPEQPDAGSAFTVTVTTDVSAPEAQGLAAALLDHEGCERAAAPLGYDHDRGLALATLNADAPPTLGRYRWTALLRATEDEAGEPLATAEVDLDTSAHSIRPAIWAVPPAIEAGAEFSVRVGLRCTAGCTARGWSFRVLDAAGDEVATGMTGDTPAPGTDALHFAEISLRAPEEDGKHLWTVVPVRPDADLPHEVHAADLRLTVIPQPDRVIRIRAVDAATGAPVDRAKVVAHPFRTFTDAEGCAEIAVPQGAYTVFVSGKQYFPFRHEVETDEDVDIVAELHVDRAYDEVDQWA